MSAGEDSSEGEDDRILAGEYALGLLDAEGARAFESRLAAEPGLRVIHAQWTEALAAMTDPIADAVPPAAVLAGIEARLFTPAPEVAPLRRWRRLGWLAGLALAAAVALALLLGPLAMAPRDPGAPALSGQLVSDTGPLVLAAAYDPASGELRLTRQAGDPAPAGRAQELWLIAEAGGAPVSLGLLGGDAAQVVPVPEGLRPVLAGATLAVSDEPSGGSPTGQPTGAVIAAGRITSL